MKHDFLFFVIDDENRVITANDDIKNAMFSRRFLSVIWILNGLAHLTLYFQTGDRWKLILTFVGLLWLFVFVSDLRKSNEKEIEFEEIEEVKYKTGTFQDSLRIKLKNKKTRVIYCDSFTRKSDELKSVLKMNAVNFRCN